ncbi:SpoIIE family protein phosphatase [Streptomyces noursei]|uniref:SpoIIE family protein phosphatase n=1 Tax=Streptomyces noursei TaxID=1971 RepID=UPI0023DB422C|nr:SpoIIE family protein phosphatase [Streptomyces noursei]
MLIPIGLIVAVCSADALSPPDVHLRPLLVAAPALGAAVAGPVPTALISGLTLAADVIVAALQGALFTENLYAQIGALIVVSALVFVFTVVRERSERRLSRSRSVAAVAQRVLLRPLPPTQRRPRNRLPLPAEEAAGMGGDLFAAARTTAHRQATLPRLARHRDGAIRSDTSQWHTTADNTNPSTGTGTGVGTEADADAETGTGTGASVGAGAGAEETFATVSLLDIPDHRHELSTISCGHPPPLLLRNGHAHPLTPATTSTSTSNNYAKTSSPTPTAASPTTPQPSPSAAPTPPPHPRSERRVTGRRKCARKLIAIPHGWAVRAARHGVSKPPTPGWLRRGEQ